MATAGTLTVLIGAAHAADMPRDLPPLPAPPPPSIVWRDWGWYVRGDFGAGWGQIGSAESENNFRAPLNPTNNKLGSTFTAGAGVGIKTRWLRTDLTFDYISSAKYKGTIVVPDDVTAKIQSTVMLFNGYFDLGTWYRLTPYIGAGAGPALVRLSDYQSTAAPPFTDGNHSQWNFAFAGMAGVGWAVAPNVMIDVGYRYLNLGNAQTASDAVGRMTFRSIADHQVRVGLRWSFDDLPEFR